MIAADLGLSVQAVSYALRGRKGVSEATRQRVLDHASRLGYRPDAGLRALADFRSGKQRVATRWNTVALVHNWPEEAGITTDRFYGTWFAELQKAAEQRGISIEIHWLGSAGQHARAVFRTLRNRGITGVFLAPPGMTPNEPRIEIPGGPFQVVTFGPGYLYPGFHTVQFDFYENLRLAWRVLSERGHRRIGLVYAKHQGWRTGYAWRAAYHVEKLLAGGTPGVRMPLEIDQPDRVMQRECYLEWLRRDRYDAVISSMPEVADWTREAGEGCEIAVFNVQRPDLQGIDLNLPQMARTAMELLYLEMQRSLQREHDLPFRVHIPGRWVEAEDGE